MEGKLMSLAQRRTVLEAAAVALEGLDEVLVQASGAELVELLGVVDAVGARAGAARVVVTAEAVTRGEVAGSGMNVHAWVREHAPSLRQGGAAQVASLAQAVAPGPSQWRPHCRAGEGVDPGSPVGMVWAGVKGGTVSPGLATAILREVGRLEPLLRDEAVPTVVAALVELGVAWGPGMMRRLRPRLLAEHGAPGVFDDLQERLAKSARLSSPVVESGDLTEYQLVMTPEQAAALEAAIGPLSAPAPNEVTGERDLRPAGQRRVEALTQVCRRSAGLDAQAQGADGAGGAASAVHVIIPLADLEQRTGCAEVVGSTASGTILCPQVLRRLACAADLVPHVLGSAGEDLDLGRVVRLFTPAQRRLLWRRDRGCSYPGCTAPAAWAQAHHVIHWLDGGLSDVDNAALLCQRHHTFVHQRRLVAAVRRTPDERGRYVVWDLTEGSYDRHLERLRVEQAINDPPPLTAERVRQLMAAITGDDPDDQRWAAVELVDQQDHLEFAEQSWHDEDWADDLWRERLDLPG